MNIQWLWWLIPLALWMFWVLEALRGIREAVQSIEARLKRGFPFDWEMEQEDPKYPRPLTAEERVRIDHIITEEAEAPEPERRLAKWGRRLGTAIRRRRGTK